MIIINYSLDYRNGEAKTMFEIFTEYKLDLSKVLNTNQHLVSDITLPTIYDNPNIKCINPECKSIIDKLPCNIAYIKYDKVKMQFMYSCNHCGQKWRNN